MGIGGGGAGGGCEVAKSLSIVRGVCDIQPALPNQCGSAQLKQRGEQEEKKRRGIYLEESSLSRGPPQHEACLSFPGGVLVSFLCLYTIKTSLFSA